MGLRKDPAWDAEGRKAPGAPLMPDPLREAPTAERAAPAAALRLPEGSAGPARDNGPAGSAHGPRPGCGKGKRNGERAEGEGGRGGPAAARAGGEARDRRARLPHRRPNKDARGAPAEPCLGGWAPEQA